MEHFFLSQERIIAPIVDTLLVETLYFFMTYMTQWDQVGKLRNLQSSWTKRSYDEHNLTLVIIVKGYFNNFHMK